MNTERIMGWTLRISAGVATSLLAAAVGLAIAGGGQSTGIAAQQSDSGGGRERSAPVVIRSLRENQTERSAVQFPVALEDMGNLEAEGAAAEEPVEDTTQILPHEDEMLLRTAMGEAEGESVEGKALVMCVILNRTESSLFPDSIEDVVFQRNQFSVTKPGGRYWTLEPDVRALELSEKSVFWAIEKKILNQNAKIEDIPYDNLCRLIHIYILHSEYSIG